jgi:Ulp1 family protease
VWARVTRTYHNDPLLHQLMHATPNQVINMWNRYDRELDSFNSELVIRRITNKNDENRTRLPVYKEYLEGLRVGDWVGNTIIDVFASKTIKRLESSGVPGIYNQFQIMDGSFMYYMYEQYRKYKYNGCRRMVTKKTVDANGHVWSFLSQEKIFAPVHKFANHWFLFAVCPVDRQITIIDSLYDQGPWHVKMFDNIVKFIHDYDKSKEIPKYKWAWHMHPVVVDKQLSLDNFGVFTCLEIYCLVYGLDYRTMPTFFFANQACI